MGDQGAALRLARRRVPTFGAAVRSDADAGAADHYVLEGERVLASEAVAVGYPYPKGIEDYTAGIAAFEDAYPKLFPFLRELLAEEEDLDVSVVPSPPQGHSRGFETLRQFPTHNAIFALAVGCTVAGFDIIANELLVRLVRHHGARALYAGVDKTVLHYLTATGSLDDTVAFEAASALINVGANPDGNPEVTECPTPLHIAARQGKLLMVRLLLEAKASLDIARPLLEGSDGGGTHPFSALGMAAMAGQTGAVRLLLSAGADPNFKACVPPLHLAVISDSPEIVHDLAAHGAKLDVTATRLGETALHFAASKGHFECASALVFLGADARLKSSSSRTALQVARAHGHDELAAWLKASEAGRKGKGGKGGKGGKAATSLPATSKALTAATVWGGTAAAAELAEIEKRRLQRLRDEEDAKAEAAEVEAKAAAAAAAEEEEQEIARVDRVLQVAEASHPDDQRSKPVLTAVAALAAAKSAAFTQCELELSLSLQRQPRDGEEAAGMKSALRAAGEKATLVAFPGMEDYASISISTEPETGMTLFFNVRLECPPSEYEREELDGFRSDVAR